MMFLQVGDTGNVVGIDHVKELIDWSEKNVRKSHCGLIESGKLKFVGE